MNRAPERVPATRAPVRGRAGGRWVIAVGALCGLALGFASTLDFGDTAEAVRSRRVRAAEAEVELARLTIRQRLRSEAPIGPPLGAVVRVPRAALEAALAIPLAEPAPEPVQPAMRAPRTSPFETLFDAALAVGARGDAERALALMEEALALPEPTPVATLQRAEAHLRALAWSTQTIGAAHLLSPIDAQGAAHQSSPIATQIAAHREALLALPATLARDGVPYHLLAALAGPVDESLLTRVHAELVANELTLPPPRDALRLDDRVGLGLDSDPLHAALEAALAARSPVDGESVELDWARAFHHDLRFARAIVRWLPADLRARLTEPPRMAALTAKWRFFAIPPAALTKAEGDTTALRRERVVGAVYLQANSMQLMVTEMSACAAALLDLETPGGGSSARQAPRDAREAKAPVLRLWRDEDHASTLAHLRATSAIGSPRVGPEVALETAGETIVGPLALDELNDLAAAVPGHGPLRVAVHAPGLAQEIAVERRRVTWLRSGLGALGALVFAASWFAARALHRETRLAELRTTFVASVSHDLRTPLSSMLLMIENLQHGRVATENARERYHRALRAETERLCRLVEDLLDAARIERGSGPRVAREEVDTAAFLDELELALHTRAEVLGARLACTRSALPSTLFIDGEALRRAIWNLFENAARHGKQAGERADVRLGFCERDGALVVDVRDDGPGIDARHTEAIFAPFERALDRRQRRGLVDDAGTGLGLAIVRAIARAHGGEARLVIASANSRLSSGSKRPNVESAVPPSRRSIGAHFELSIPLTAPPTGGAV